MNTTQAEALKQLHEKVKAIPTREEFLGGQRTKYVQLDEVIGWIEQAAKQVQPVAPIRLLQTDAEYKTMLEYTNHLADLIDGNEGHELWPIFQINQDIIMQWEQRPDFKEPAQHSAASPAPCPFCGGTSSHDMDYPHPTQQASEATLRELLATTYAGALLYRDDGELQDNREAPFIDFKHDSVQGIAIKMGIRGMRAAAAPSTEETAATGEPDPHGDSYDCEREHAGLALLDAILKSKPASQAVPSLPDEPLPPPIFSQEHSDAMYRAGMIQAGKMPQTPAPSVSAGAVPELTDDEIVKVLTSLGIDTYPSKYGFPELQVSATNVPMIRKIVAAYLAAAPSAPSANADKQNAARQDIGDEAFAAIVKRYEDAGEPQNASIIRQQWDVAKSRRPAAVGAGGQEGDAAIATQSKEGGAA